MGKTGKESKVFGKLVLSGIRVLFSLRGRQKGKEPSEQHRWLDLIDRRQSDFSLLSLGIFSIWLSPDLGYS